VRGVAGLTPQGWLKGCRGGQGACRCANHRRVAAALELLALLGGYVERVEAALRRRLEAAWSALLTALLRLQHE
jgi:hypothetical protein